LTTKGQPSNDPIDIFGNALEILKKEYKNGLANQTFIENQLVVISSQILQKSKKADGKIAKMFEGSSDTDTKAMIEECAKNIQL
jgi:hypothetical protein